MVDLPLSPNQKLWLKDDMDSFTNITFFLLYVSDLLRCVKHCQYLLYPGCFFFNFDVLASRSPCCVLLALSWNTNEYPSRDKLSRVINYVLAELFPRKRIHSFCFFSIYIFLVNNSLPATDLLLIPSDLFLSLFWFCWDVGEDWALWSAGFNDNEKHQFYSRLSWKLNVRGLASVLFLKLRTITTAKEGTVATTIKTKADTTTE